MSKKDVQDYLDKGMYGTPQIKPEEQRKYLGTFRERIFFAMTIQEMRDKKNLAYFKKELQANPNQQLLINAAVGFSIQNEYMIVAQQQRSNFKIVDTDNQSHPEAIGLVYATDYAVNCEVISISEKYGEQKLTAPQTKPSTTSTSDKKESWFGKLFK